MLLKSIRSVKHINTALVVISIDIYDETINELIRGILEIEPIVCFTIIYHPYSMAFYHNQFPAEDPHDCSRGKFYVIAPIRPQRTRTALRRRTGKRPGFHFTLRSNKCKD